MSERILYELAAADPAVRFSPYCWRSRLALAHKGLPVETRPWRFTDREALAFSGQGRVPVLVDGGRVVSDSFAIASYLEEAYPDAPALMPGGPGASAFVVAWADGVLNPGLSRLVVADILAAVAPQDRDYFRESREARFGAALETVQDEGRARVEAFRASLAPLRLALARHPFLAGAAPTYADYAVFGGFAWVRAISAFSVLAEDDPVAAWCARMLDLFDGLVGSAPRAV